MGWHNLIWGRANGGQSALYAIDFGNARYIPPFYTDYIIKNIDVLGRSPTDIPMMRVMDKGIDLLLLYDFEGMLWNESMKLTEDYAHCLDWMSAGIEAAKRSSSREHVTAFAEKCRKHNNLTVPC